MQVDSASPPASKPFRHVRCYSGHGLTFGQGRKTENGLHANDSLSLSLRQRPGGGRLTENAAVASNTNMRKNKLQSGDASFSLRYKLGGFSMGAETGIAYTSILYNKLTRTEKVKAEASTDFRYGADLSQRLALDADSTWEVRAAAGYDDLGETFRTWSGSCGLTKSIGDFEFGAAGSGYRQRQDQSPSVCAGKTGKACADSSRQITVGGAGLAFQADWDNGSHLVSLRSAMDWQFASALDRVLTLGASYAYSPWSWLDLGVYAQQEKDFDATSNAKFWVAGAGLSVGF
ncbi:MAG: hypothetical protein JWO30_1178 [Fibrobacteres bacterium]|nr:hypothetical protein [Fibrobacterota bacterium]